MVGFSGEIPLIGNEAIRLISRDDVTVPVGFQDFLEEVEAVVPRIVGD